MDFESNCCYNVAAVDANGNINTGLDPVKAHLEDCRGDGQLFHSNSYSRHMCNRGWCAIMYGYYFEMDSVTIIPGVLNEGHRNDWEHVAVWVKDGAVKYVSTSAHGDFNVSPVSDVRFKGTRPKIVYHKDWKLTRNMRLAKAADDNVENSTGDWFDSHLVGWDGFPSTSIRDKMVTYNFGSAHMQFVNDEFPHFLSKSMPQEAADAGFDCGYDDGSQNAY